jgi:hypothetical protein
LHIEEEDDNQVASPWCKVVRQFLVQSSIEQTYFVQEIRSDFCISCQHKQSTGPVISTSQGIPSDWHHGFEDSKKSSLVGYQVSNNKHMRKARCKRRHLQDKYSVKKKKMEVHSLDGSLFFPSLGVLIKSDLNHFDTLAMADQVHYASEGGVQHMNITPLNAYQLEQQGFFPEGQKSEIEILHEDAMASYPSPMNPDITIHQNCELIVIDSIKASLLCGTSKQNGCDWITGSEIMRAVDYLSPAHLQSAVARNVDVIGIFATPINPYGDLHCLTMRWISKPAIIRTPDDSQELFDYFWGLLSQAKGKMEISRVGGSNGNAHVSAEFLKMLHLPGITPRKSHGVMWYAVKTKWYFLYISPYKKKRKLCCRPYCQPLPGGQARISRTKFSKSPRYFKSVFKDFLLTKAESAPLVSSLNKAIFRPHLGMPACREANSVQEASNCIARLSARIKHDPEQFFFHLLSSCSFTIIAYATRLHVDTPKAHPFIPVKGFWENKWIIDVPSKSTHDVTGPALGRGGAGRGKFVFAVLDHSYDLCDKYAWEKSDKDLFRELVRVAREEGLGGPDALEAHALVPSLMEAAMVEIGEYHLESVA